MMTNDSLRSVSLEDRYRFLALFARPGLEEPHIRAIRQETRGKGEEWPGWREVVPLAEEHGLAPLLHRNLLTAGLECPDRARRELQGLTLRHRHAARAQTVVMEELLAGFDSAGFSALVLKGGALGHLLYDDPGLRPSGDLDLLVQESDLPKAGKVMEGIGFRTSTPEHSPSAAFMEKHLPPAFLDRDGIVVKIDLHYELFRKDRPHALKSADLASRSRIFTTRKGGPEARTLGYEDMLGHLSLHLGDIYHEPLLSGKTRLIWVADIVGFASRFSESIDWEEIASRYPYVLATLALLHYLTPLPETLVKRAGLKIVPPPGEPGRGYAGWPAATLSRQKRGDLPRWLRETFFPPEWSIRLYYGIGAERSLVYHRLVRHPLHIMANLGRLMIRRVRGGRN
jgi:hypothetical protein